MLLVESIGEKRCLAAEEIQKTNLNFGYFSARLGGNPGRFAIFCLQGALASPGETIIMQGAHYFSYRSTIDVLLTQLRR